MNGILNSKFSKESLWVWAILFTAYFIIGGLIITQNIPTDIQLHAEACQRINKGELGYGGTFLMYFLVNLFSGFSTHQEILSLVLVAFISIGFGAKGFLTFQILNLEKKNKGAFWISILASFFFAIPVLFYYRDHYYYLSAQNPNNFHNSSIILSSPISLLIFFLQLEVWKEFSIKKVYQITFLVLLNIFIKPSFIFVFSVITPLFSLYFFRLGKEFFISLVPVVGALFGLIFQYLFIFIFEQGALIQGDSKVVLSFFDYWTLFYPPHFYVYSMAGSFLFPIAYFLFTLRNRKEVSFFYTAAMVIFAMLIFIFVSETGPRRNHGNFIWQIIPCYYIFLISILKDSLQLAERGRLSRFKLGILAAFFGLHIISGLIYLYRILVLHDFY
jgi:hypothetical protein